MLILAQNFSYAQNVTHGHLKQSQCIDMKIDLLMVGDFNRAFEKDWGGIGDGGQVAD